MKNFSVISLIAANSVPFFGVLFLDWSLFSVMFFYWSEAIVISFYDILKMAKAEQIVLEPREYFSGKLSFILSFIAFYGFVMGMYGLFIFSLFSHSEVSIPNLLFGITSLFISHGVSYLENFIGKKEYKRVPLKILFTQPVYRMAVMHITIIFGAFAILALNLPPLSILIFVIVKTIIDFYSHKREHEKFSETEGIYKTRIFKDGKLFTQSSNGLQPLNVTKPTKEELQQIRKKMDSAMTGLMTKEVFKDAFDAVISGSGIAKEELQQKMQSILEKEFSQKVNPESEKEKINKEIPSEKDNTKE